jgi:hypothetical protein
MVKTAVLNILGEPQQVLKPSHPSAEYMCHQYNLKKLYAVPIDWFGVFRMGLRTNIIQLRIRLLGAFATFRKAAVIFVLSACQSTCNNSAPSERFFIKFDIWVFCENLSRKFKFYWNLVILTGTLHEDLWYLAQFCFEWEVPQTKLSRRLKHTFCAQ